MPTACITGASSGIGEQFARQLADQGYDLILVARNKEKLEKLAEEIPTRTKIIIKDLGDEKQCYELGDYLAKHTPSLFINNAGFGSVGPFAELDIKREIEMVNLNCKAVEILMGCVLPAMVKKDRGYILNVGSVAGLFDGGPYMATYYASKSFVVSLSSSVNAELKSMGSKVRVSVLCPGPVDTNFNKVAGVKFALPGISPEKCVRDCLRQMKSQKLIIVPGRFMGIMMKFARLAPRSLQLALIQNGQKSKIGL